MTRRICAVTGSRAEYGLLRPLLRRLQHASTFELQLIVTGMHLSVQHGNTVEEIKTDGFRIDAAIETQLSSDTPIAVTKSIGLSAIGFADALGRLQPDLLVVLGDRFEILPAAVAALVARIPVVHLHGGESTEGAIDEAIRHAITKMSYVHFVAAEEYRQRVVQLGEHPDRVFVVGALGIDAIQEVPRLSRAELEAALGLSFTARNLLVTFHPATLETASVGAQVDELLAALEDLEDTQLIFTLPNADPGSQEISARIQAFVGRHAHAHAFASLGTQRYVSCLEQIDGVIGNSSSGLIEVPALRKGTINIGDRQRGRLRGSSVIDCAPDRSQIRQAIARLYSPEFRARLMQVRNPYGDGRASARIVETLDSLPHPVCLKKPFYDLPLEIGQPSR